MKKYKIIYADPPWKYKDKALAGNRGAICKYPVMGGGRVVGATDNRTSGQYLYPFYVGNYA